MKNKRDIYCDYQFWEAFFDKEEEIFRDRSNRILWDAFYKFLSNNNLYFNVPFQSIREETIGGENLLRIRHEKGGASIKFIPKKFPKIEALTNVNDNILNSVFLTMLDISTCKELSSRYGVIVFNLQMVFSASHVFIDNEIPFDEENGNNWTYLGEFKEKCPSISYCNSIVIVDRYLVINSSRNTLNANLKPILDSLLPLSLDNNIIFTICILSEKRSNNDVNMENKADQYRRLIKELRPDLRFELTIFNINSLHDRSLLTNNIMLRIGIGFDVIMTNQKARKFSTPSLCFPFLQTAVNVNGGTYIDWLNNVLKKTRNCNSYRINYWGDSEKRNHLLDFYREEPPRLRETHQVEPDVFSDLFRQRCYRHDSVDMG